MHRWFASGVLFFALASLARSLQHVINQSNPNEPTKAIGKQTKKLEQQKPQQYNDNHHDISLRRIRSEDRARRSGARNRRRQGPWPGKCIVAPDISFELTSSIIGPPIRIVAFQSALLFAKFSMFIYFVSVSTRQQVMGNIGVDVPPGTSFLF